MIARMLLTTALAVAQIPAAAPGHAVISGRVVDEFGDPVIRARVFVEAANGPTRRPIGMGEADDRGEYRIPRLAAGHYFVSVLRLNAFIIRPDFIAVGSSAEEAMKKTYYPHASDVAEAETLQVADGDTLESIDFVLSAAPPPLPPLAAARAQKLAAAGASAESAQASGGTASIRGRVITPDRRALAHAHVQLVPGGDVARTIVALADSDGRFVFRDLASGHVLVSASKPGYDAVVAEKTLDLRSGQTRDDIELLLARWSAISGYVTDERGAPVFGAAVQALQLHYDNGRRRLVPMGTPRMTNDLGRFRLYGLADGQYVISAAISGAASVDMPGYAPSFYPGTTNPAAAQFVSIRAADDLDGIDIALGRTPTARISGKVLNAAGLPTNPGSLSLVSSVRSASPVSMSIGAKLDADGMFAFPNVPAGQYVIHAYRGRTRPWIEGEFGTLAVTVDGSDISDLIVRTSAGSSIAGRVAFSGSSASKLPPVSSFEMRPLPADFDAAPSDVATADVHADWTFEMGGVNGSRRLAVTRAPAGWALQEIRVRGTDVTDRPLAFGTREQSISGVEVVLTDRMTGLDATVASGDGRDMQGTAIVVFAADRDRWYPESRFLNRCLADAKGTCSFAGLPFGSYYVAAVTEKLTGNDWQDPAFLETLARRASTITLREGETETIKLRAP